MSQRATTNAGILTTAKLLLALSLVLSSNAEPLLAQSAKKDKPETPETEKFDSKAAVNQALKAYKAGRYGEAATLLAKDLKAHPEDGKTHYYLGLALKKQGYDMSALKQLEMAARLVPPEMISSFAEEKLEGLDKTKLVLPAAPAKPKDWFSQMTTGVTEFLGLTKPVPNTTTISPASSSTTSASPFEMPDFFGSINGAIRNGKKMIKSAGHPNGESSARATGGPAEIMHMDEMLDLVDKSKSMNVPQWASHAEGLTVYHQAPEGTAAWDFWIARFKRSIQHVLLKRLSAEATDQVRGAAAVIFSVDRKGNLKGSIYASTADPVLNKCLVEAIRDLNHSRILAFPANSDITGWNFQMTWNFGKYLAYIQNHREQEKRAQINKEIVDMLLKNEELKSRILKSTHERELKAKMKKLAKQREKEKEKATAARLLEQQRQVKTEVAGHVMTKPQEKELRAVTLELNDISVKPGDPMPQGDPFATIDDDKILSWPDLNR